MTQSPSTSRTIADGVALCLLKAVIGAWVLRSGFSHVSDDDYARTVIAEQFAHAASIDPSGTSWLPLPFWLTGIAMGVAGRSLAVARAVAFVLGVASVAAPYAALRAAAVERAPALAAAALAMALPWNAWLGVATVPEAWAGALGAAGVLAMANDRARPWCACALLAASLSRYEAWPACAMLAALCGSRWFPRRFRGDGSRDWGDVACAAIALGGPIAWMAWNAHAHGSPLHFLARVSAFRRSIGAAGLPLQSKLLGYPYALATETPEAALLGAPGIVGLVVSRSFRSRWRWPAAATAAVLVFLIAGDLKDGAPTHHPERALCILWWVLTACGADALAMAFARPPKTAIRAVAVCAAGVGLAWCISLPSRYRGAPGTSAWDRREAQIARGYDMRARRVAAADVTPCAFEHFALIAAWGQPERATVRAPTHEPPTPDCPRVVEH